MILLLSDDLMDASKTVAHGRALGIAVTQCETLAKLLTQLKAGGTKCCIVDLGHPLLQLEELMLTVAELDLRPRLIAYGSHVNTVRLNEARKAGFDEVLPRSKYFEQMPTNLTDWQGTAEIPSPTS